MTQPTRPTPGKPKDDETKIPGSDSSGEMEDAGGGRRSSARPDDPKRPTRGGPAIPPGSPAPIVPRKPMDDDDEDADRDERGRSKQHGR